MGRLKTLWTNVESSLWFVPILMIFGAAGLAYGLIEVDAHSSWELQKKFPRFFGVSAEGSRTILSAIAGSTIAIAGVTFSITIVALSLAASQYTPRLLRNFMRDRSNQIVLGTLVSIFIYCLIVLRTIKGGEEPFVPAVSIVSAIVLAIGGIIAFIYFIHHIATGIQAATILNSIAVETNGAIESLFPDELGHETEPMEGTEEERALLHDRHWEPVPVDCSGYLQNVENESLLNYAAKNDCIIKVERCIGDFVCKGTPIVSIMGWHGVEKKHVKKINRLFGIDSYRSIYQDPAFGVRQIVDVALKALSPGINDPTTAKTCIDYLGTVLRNLGDRKVPSPFRYCEGKLRVIAFGPTFESLVDLMFHEIRQHASSNVSVVIRTLDTIEKVADSIETSARRAVLWKHAHLIASQALEKVQNPTDRQVINKHLQKAAETLRQPLLSQPQLFSEKLA